MLITPIPKALNCFFFLTSIIVNMKSSNSLLALPDFVNLCICF